VEQLSYGLMLASGNDAAHALAEVAGGQQQAIDAMNAEAERLGAWRTRALTPHGLDEPGQVSTPYDLALLVRAALADERVAGPARTATYDFPGGRAGPTRSRTRTGSSAATPAQSGSRPASRPRRATPWRPRPSVTAAC
jgi:D-alanyl-D-alanine carboxypeptidase